MNFLAILAATALVAKALHEIHKTRRRAANERRKTILAILHQAPNGATATAISEATGRWPGTIYTDLARLEADRRITSWWIPTEPPPDGTPRRRYYGLATRRSTWNDMSQETDDA